MKRFAVFLLFLIVACTPVQNVFEDCGDLAPVPYKGVEICVSYDYYALNGIRMPVGLTEAYRIADERNMRLPTPDMVDSIWAHADVQLRPQPLPPGPSMTSESYFRRHDALIEEQLAGRRGLIAGHKKDIVEAGRFNPRVAIYGWHRQNGVPIQPYNNTSHGREYRDYSHGLRLVAPYVIVNNTRVLMK